MADNDRAEPSTSTRQERMQELKKTDDEVDLDKDMGRAVQVIRVRPDNSFELDEDALAEILLSEDVRERSVVVVSVAGAFRKGKSFLLDFFLRYMNSRYGSQPAENAENSWLGDDTEPLGGFSWRGGSEHDTTGILVWSKVFQATLPPSKPGEPGEQVAVLIMDTQGAFDSQSTVRDCATVFALSTMLSSVQIYNLSQNIQEDDLQHLQLSIDYGRVALDRSVSTPFQRLQFLVRDWSSLDEAAYGAEGGEKILQRRLQISDAQHPELQSLRKHITLCFSKISCFLMPHSGLSIDTNPKFDGRLAEIESEFKQQLRRLVPMLLAPENLVTKKIDGQVVKARELLEYFKSLIKICKGDELPEPMNLLMATAEANNLSAVAEAKDLYLSMMEAEHVRCADAALKQFQMKQKMGTEQFQQVFKLNLQKVLEDSFYQLKMSKQLRRAVPNLESALQEHKDDSDNEEKESPVKRRKRKNPRNASGEKVQPEKETEEIPEEVALSSWRKQKSAVGSSAAPSSKSTTGSVISTDTDSVSPTLVQDDKVTGDRKKNSHMSLNPAPPKIYILQSVR